MSGKGGFKPYPVLEIMDDDGMTAIQVVDSKGNLFLMDVNNDTKSIQRMVDCWNACRNLYSPAAHIAETDAYIERLKKIGETK